MSTTSYTLTALAVGSFPLFAQAAEVSGSEQTIIVTADRRDAERDRASNSVEVVDRCDDARQGHSLNLTDRLQGLPGVDIVSSGGGLDGGTSSIRLRGGRSQDTRFLIDGIPLNDPLSIDGSVNAAFVPSAGLERIEIVKGAQSGVYGSNAVGGVVNVLSARPTTTVQADGLVEAGSFQTMRTTGTVTGPIRPGLGYAMGVDVLNSNGFSAATDANAQGNPLDYESDSVRRAGATGRVEWQPISAATMYVGGFYQANNQEWDGYGASGLDPEDASSITQVRQWRSSAGGTIKPTRELTVVLDSACTSMSRVLHGDGWTSPFTNREQYAAARATYALHPMVDATVGGDGTWDQADTDSLTVGDRTLGAWGQTAFHHQVVEATATVRRDHNATAGGATTYRLGAATFTPRHELKLHANLGTGFVIPTLDQRYASYPGYPGFYAPTEGNPNLTPERSLSRDAGLTVQPIPELGASADVTVFRTDYEDRIVYVRGDPLTGISTYQNLSQGRIDGVETSATLDDAASPLHVRLSATWQRFEDASNTLQRLLPNRKARAEAGWRWTAVQVGGHVDAVDRRWNLDGSEQELPGYLLVGANITWLVTSTTSLYVRGDNLTNTHYDMNPGYSTMPRAFFVGGTARL